MALDVFAMAPDGSGKVNLTRSADGEADPIWSPDGSQIAYALYATEKTADLGIHVMGPDGSGSVR